MSPAEVEPGAIAVVRVDDPGLSPARVVGHFRGARLAFFKGADGRPRALVGVDLATPPGAHRLTVEHTGLPASPPATILLTVRAKQFPREDLTVDRRYVEPDARTLERIRRERERLDAVLAAGIARATPAWGVRDTSPPARSAHPSGCGASSMDRNAARTPDKTCGCPKERR